MNTRIEMLKRYLEEDPSDSFLRYALALEFIALNEAKLAISQLEKLLEDDPDYLPAYYMAGKTSESLGMISNAEIWYKKGMEVARSQKDQHTLSELSTALELLDDLNKH
jgi:tetratricopeptide (TPR) repeat protein